MLSGGHAYLLIVQSATIVSDKGDYERLLGGPFALPLIRGLFLSDRKCLAENTRQAEAAPHLDELAVMEPLMPGHCRGERANTAWADC